MYGWYFLVKKYCLYIIGNEVGDMCMRCHRKKIGCLFRPCDHSCCCWDCGNNVTECLICKSPVQNRFIISVDPEENDPVR